MFHVMYLFVYRTVDCFAMISFRINLNNSIPYSFLSSMHNHLDSTIVIHQSMDQSVSQSVNARHLTFARNPFIKWFKIDIKCSINDHKSWCVFIIKRLIGHWKEGSNKVSEKQKQTRVLDFIDCRIGISYIHAQSISIAYWPLKSNGT